MKRLATTVLTTTLVAISSGCGGGNYSNEDIDFQLGLPERDELTVKLPTQSIVVAGSAEYFVMTRKVVRDFNFIVDAFLGLIDTVRSFPPTQRLPGVRIWGPFADEKKTGWRMRVVMTRRGDALAPEGFDYAVEFRRATDSTGPWLTLIDGTYAVGGGVAAGKGTLNYKTTDARRVGYPLGDLDGVDSLIIEHDRTSDPRSVSVSLKGFPTDAALTYRYTEKNDGSGTLLFVFPTPESAPGVAEIDVRSRWTGSGAGRADVTVTKGTVLFLGGARGVDCWGTDTLPTYSIRSWQAGGQPATGTESSCVFGPP